MKKTRKLLLFIACLSYPITLHADAYDDLAKEIVKGSEQLKTKKIAILPLEHIGKKESPAPQIISERLTTRIVRLGTIQVVERNLH